MWHTSKNSRFALSHENVRDFPSFVVHYYYYYCCCCCCYVVIVVVIVLVVVVDIVVVIVIIVIDRFCMASFSALEQTRCALIAGNSE